MGKDASTIKQEIEQTRERMGDTVEALGYKADVGSRVKDTVAERVESVKETFGGAVENVRNAVNGTSDVMSKQTQSGTNRVGAAVGNLNSAVSEKLSNVDMQAGTQRVVGIARENPIGLTFVGLAIGFLTGSLLPVSDIERERLGPIRDKVVDQANAATSDLVDAGKAVVADTVSAVMSTAKSSAQAHGKDVVDAAKARADQP